MIFMCMDLMPAACRVLLFFFSTSFLCIYERTQAQRAQRTVELFGLSGVSSICVRKKIQVNTHIRLMLLVRLFGYILYA